MPGGRRTRERRAHLVDEDRSTKRRRIEDAPPEEQVAANHVLMKRIFKSLNSWDLMTCRSISKKWNKESIDILKEKSIVRLSPGRVATFQNLLRAADRDDFISSFRDVEINLNDFEDLTELDVLFGRWSCLRAVSLAFNSDSPQHVRFLSKHSESVRRLKLETSWNTEEQVPNELDVPFPVLNFFHLDCKGFTNGSAASINEEPVYFENFRHVPTSLILNIMNSAPDLNSLKLESGNSDYSMLQGTIQGSDLAKLTKLELLCDPESIEVVRQIGMKVSNELEILKIPDIGETLPRDLSDLFISLSSDTLVSLTLNSIDATDAEIESRFPYCPSLTHLELKSMGVGKDFKFWGQVPSLKSLKVKDLWDSAPEQYDSVEPSPSVESICITTSKPYDLCPEALEWIICKFPNISMWDVTYDFLSRFLYIYEETQRPVWVPRIKGLTLHCFSGVRYRKTEDVVPLYLFKLWHFKWLMHLDLVDYNDFSVINVPFDCFYNLESLRFVWSPYICLMELKKNFRNLKRAYVRNCCSFKRKSNFSEWEKLRDFFKEIPIAVCGCKDTAYF